MSDIHQKWKNRVRPNVNETLANEEDVESIRGDEGESEEARPIAGQKAIYKPTSEEWDNHMRTHIPFRRWCPFCVKGKCKSNPHWQKSKSSEELESETQVCRTIPLFIHSVRSQLRAPVVAQAGLQICIPPSHPGYRFSTSARSNVKTDRCCIQSPDVMCERALG